MSEIHSTRDWFATSGQIPYDAAPSVRQAAFYTGMQLEEVAEKLAEVFGPMDYAATLIQALQITGDMFKKGAYDQIVEVALENNAKGMLDADLDLIWVSIGAGAAQAADVAGAYGEVGRANWDKFPDGVVTRHPLTGKVVKPDGWRGPDLLPFIHASLRQPATDAVIKQPGA